MRFVALSLFLFLACMGALALDTEKIERVAEKTSLTFSWLSIASVLLTLAIVYDQYSYHSKKGTIPGPLWTIPFIGKLFDSMNPKFTNYLDQWNQGKLVCTKVFNKFIVLSSSTDLSRKIFNSPSSIIPCVIPSMKEILTPDNFVFFQGEAHYIYRKRLNPLFTRRALSIYLPRMEEITRQHINKWFKELQEPKAFYEYARDFTVRTSLSVFCGNHIPEKDVAEISASYFHLTRSLQLVNFPWALPGTKVWKAIQARKRIVRVFTECVNRSLVYIQEGNEPTCMIDEWIYNEKKDRDAWEQDPEGPEPQAFSTKEKTLTLLAFLFASQDALTSSVVWLMAMLEAHPDILERVREEQFSLRVADEPLTLDSIHKMSFSLQVIKETLRYRPPVIMVPQETRKEIMLDEYLIPKGTILIPSIWPSTHDPEAYENPNTFDPDRFGPERKEDVKSSKNYLVFGHGPHGCIAKDYAYDTLLAFLSTVSTQCEWKRKRTPDSEEIKIIATLFPKDDCLLSIKPYQRDIQASE